MSSPPVNFDSRPDSRGQTTRLQLDPSAATIKSVTLLKAGEAQPALGLQTAAAGLFTVRFIKFSLDGNKRLPEVVEYRAKPGSGDLPPQPGTGSLTLTYERVTASAAGFDPMRVVVTLTAASDPPGFQGASADSGWIDFDLQYTPPRQIAGDQHVAWETEVVFPELALSTAAAADYLLLDPLGRVGNFLKLSEQPFGRLMPLQFAALYKLGSAGGFERATGLAVSATDEQGHSKLLYYGPSAGGRTLACQLTLPIHLKAVGGVPNCFVRADTYTLSGGADRGFSGAGMRYRLRAFQLGPAVKNAPADWQDVAALYRDWVRGRRPSFYRKHVERPADAFGNTMSPHTVVANYGLDGHIDPSVVDPKLPDLRQWLEVHPVVVDGAADMPGNHPHKPDHNLSLQDLLVRAKERFGVPGMRLEAQLWGFELAGFYHFCGAFPPSTNVITGKGRKFQRALEGLVAQGVLPCVTTDVLNTNFARRRLGGHLLRDGRNWREAIPHGFPTAVRNATCAEPPHATDQRLFDATGCPEAATLSASWLVGPDGARQESVALTRFYNVYGRKICPTRAVADLYLNVWLGANLVGWGVKLVEFMKHNLDRYRCYDKGHQHVDPEPGRPYDNVVGCGPWYVQRLRQLLGRVQELGRDRVGKDFVLSNEFGFPETLVPYIDDFYDYDYSSLNLYTRDMRSPALLPNPGDERRVPVFRFVFNELVTMKMNLADAAPNIHPGYRERRKGQRPVPPAYMLDPARDRENSAALKFATWQRECVNYFEANYEVVSHGIAPTDYPTNSGGSYTFNQCVQSVFNLRSHIFRYGVAAVLGERIYLYSTLLEDPSDYNEEAVNMGVHAAHMQLRFAAFFRGSMLGQTRLTAGNQEVWAWRVHRRNFNDVDPLARRLYTGLELDGQEAQDTSPPTPAVPPVPTAIYDFISRGTDRETRVPVGKFDYKAQPEFNPPGAGRIVTDVIQHMIWQRPVGAGLRTLYAFANVGNTARPVSFLYTRGLEDGAGWKRVLHTFAGDPGGNPSAPKTVRAGDADTINIPARSCAAVLLFK